MAKKKVRDYLEPWTAAKDLTWESSYRTAPVESEHRDADAVKKWHDDRAKADESAHWFVWGSRMTPPTMIEGFMGGLHIWEGKGILAFSRNLGMMQDAPSHEEACKRACECVNACRGISAPEKLIEDVRGLLLDIVQGQTGPEDKRILSCLGRLIPLEELEAACGDS